MRPPGQLPRHVQRATAIALTIAVALFGVQVFQGGDQTARTMPDVIALSHKLPATSGAPERGAWQVNGVELTSEGFSPGPRTLRRRWMFYDRCTAARCRPWFARTTPFGVQRSPLTLRDGRWFATFRLRPRGCGTTRLGRQVQGMVLSVAPDGRHIRALEVNRATFPDCRASGAVGRTDVHAVGTTSWTAAFARPSCVSPRCAPARATRSPA